MSPESLEHYSKDQLIAELINRQTFVGLVVFHRGDAKAGRLDPGEMVLTVSPPLANREGVNQVLEIAQSIVPAMFGSELTASGSLLPLPQDTSPLRVDEGDVLRVGAGRVSIDLIVEKYESGSTPEDVVRAFDTLTLADVYSVIGFYLRHRDWVRGYLTRREEEAAGLRDKVESERPRLTREALLERRISLETDHAATGH